MLTAGAACSRAKRRGYKATRKGSSITLTSRDGTRVLLANASPTAVDDFLRNANKRERDRAWPEAKPPTAKSGE